KDKQAQERANRLSKTPEFKREQKASGESGKRKKKNKNDQEKKEKEPKQPKRGDIGKKPSDKKDGGGKGGKGRTTGDRTKPDTAGKDKGAGKAPGGAGIAGSGGESTGIKGAGGGKKGRTGFGSDRGKHDKGMGRTKVSIAGTQTEPDRLADQTIARLSTRTQTKAKMMLNGK